MPEVLEQKEFLTGIFGHREGSKASEMRTETKADKKEIARKGNKRTKYV